MKQLIAIKNQIGAIKGVTHTRLAKLELKASKAFRKFIESKQDAIKAMVSLVESSKDLSLSEYDGWPVQWARVDFDVLGLDLSDAFYKTLLSEYLSEEYAVDADFENDCLTMNQGPALLINEDGDVLDQDSGKWVISKRDYFGSAELFSQIEKHMESTGCFPSVIRVDRYGNAFYVNTQKVEVAS